MPIIKAGTYRFIDTPNLPEGNTSGYFVVALTDGLGANILIKSTINGVEYSVLANDISITGFGSNLTFYCLFINPETDLIEIPGRVPVYTSDGGWIDYDGKTINTFELYSDVETDDASFEWFSENTEPVAPVAEVTYNGVTLVSLKAGETKTLKCAGKKMKTDIVITT